MGNLFNCYGFTPALHHCLLCLPVGLYSRGKCTAVALDSQTCCQWKEPLAVSVLITLVVQK